MIISVQIHKPYSNLHLISLNWNKIILQPDDGTGNSVNIHQTVPFEAV